MWTDGTSCLPCEVSFQARARLGVVARRPSRVGLSPAHSISVRTASATWSDTIIFPSGPNSLLSSIIAPPSLLPSCRTFRPPRADKQGRDKKNLWPPAKFTLRNLGFFQLSRGAFSRRFFDQNSDFTLSSTRTTPTP